MAIAELYAVTQTGLSTTEWSLTTDTAGPDVDTNDGVFQAFLDVTDMVTGDELEIKIYEKVQSGLTQRLVYQSNLVGPQSPPVWVSPTLILMHGWDMTVKAVSGTIDIYGSIRQVA